MRVLLISGSLPPMKCGVGDYTANLANALMECKGIAVAVLTDQAAVPIPKEFVFEVLPIARGWKMADLNRIARTVRHWAPDVIHFQYPTQGYGREYLPWLLPAFFRFFNIPVVQTWHEYHLDKAKRNILNAVLSGGLIAVRPNYKDTMPGWYRWLIRRKCFEFIPNASAIPKVCLTESAQIDEKSRVGATANNLVVYFGFLLPAKRVELIFEIADPAQDHLVLICDLDPQDEYHRKIQDRMRDPAWSGKVTLTGFLPADKVGSLLAAADAVVLPFREGGGEWNTSIHAAVLQGSFVLTTSIQHKGYDASQNIYFAAPEDVADMRSALRTFSGKKASAESNNSVYDWKAIADRHKALYQTVLCPS